MRPVLERFARALVVLGVGALSMLAAHCGGYQLADTLGFGAAAHGGVGHPGADIHAGSHAVHGSHAAHAGSHAAHAAHAPAPVATGDPHADHAHVVPLASGALLVVSAAVLVVVVVAGRRTRLRVPGVRALLATQLGIFAAMEVGERWAAGADPVAALGERRVLLALVLQLPVALLVVRFGRRVAALVAAILGRRRAVRHPAPTDAARPVVDLVWPTACHVGLTAAPRGPPRKRSFTI